MFEPGQQVVCIDDNFVPEIRDYFNALPVKGTTYTVRDLVPGQHWDMQEEPAIYLVELVNAPNQHGIEPGFQSRRFAEPEEVTEHVTVGASEEEPAWT